MVVMSTVDKIAFSSMRFPILAVGTQASWAGKPDCSGAASVHQHLSFPECLKNVSRESLISELANEALDRAFLP